MPNDFIRSMAANKNDMKNTTVISLYDPRFIQNHGGAGDMMFGRFTERAQKVLALAQEEAVRLGHNNIGTEHILLGLIREGEGIAAKALIGLGLGLEKIQDEVETLIGRGQEQPTNIAYTPRAKK